MSDNLVSAMQPSLRERYTELKNTNLGYQRDLEGMNQALDALNSKRATLEDELSVSAVKREAVQLFEQLRNAEQKRDELLTEEQVRHNHSKARPTCVRKSRFSHADGYFYVYHAI